MSSSSDDCDGQEQDTEVQSSFDLLPEHTKNKYMIVYEDFKKWRESNNVLSVSEDVTLIYFKEKAEKYKPSTLWCTYSMLKNTLLTYEGVDMSKYSKVLSYLKKISVGFSKTQCKTFTEEQLQKFLNEAPDEIYLVVKVAAIFGVVGACTSKELVNMSTKDIKDYGALMHVTVRNSPRSKLPSRIFIVEGDYYNIVKKYDSIRVKTDKTDRYFQNYQKEKCTCQPIGKNKLGAMPSEIAKYLGLPNPEKYTGCSFKSTSTALHDLNKKTRKKRCRRQYLNMAQEFGKVSSDHEDSFKTVRAEQSNVDPAKDLGDLKTSIKIEIEETSAEYENENNYESSPSTSSDEPLSSYANNENSHPHTDFEYEVNGEGVDDMGPVLNSLLKMPSKRISLHFHNCTFHNSFNH